MEFLCYKIIEYGMEGRVYVIYLILFVVKDFSY